MGASLGQTERPSSKSPHAPESERKEDVDDVTLERKYAEACEKLANVVRETGFLEDPRGVLVAEALSATDADYGHVEYYRRSDGLWDAYLRKMPLGAHQIVQPTVASQETTWRLTSNPPVPDELPNVFVSNDKSLCLLWDREVEAEVDVGVCLCLGPERQGWRAVVETEVKNLNLTDMNRRLLFYMTSALNGISWRRLRLCIGMKVFEQRADGRWVCIACVWRRGDNDIPMFERAFDVGTRNYDGNQNDAICNLVGWLRSEVSAGRIALGPTIDLDNFVVTSVPSPPGLPIPLPVRRGRIVVPEAEELRDHFIVPLHPDELCYDSGLPQELVNQVPALPLNLFDIMLQFGVFGSDWNTHRPLPS
mmetsp:Transcript_18720/g.60489  ORF Transcript_18720/g.60489 Transcript_18720/m.60489 type:complete len:364 (+) Transcript_18720:42-1133(+)